MHRVRARHLGLVGSIVFAASACTEEVEYDPFASASVTVTATGGGDDDDDDGTGASTGGEDSGDADASATDPTADATSADEESGTDPTGDAGCGNGVLEPGEDCDGVDLGDDDCVTQGFSAGALGCAADCMFDTTQCTSDAPVCGDDTIDPGEECDGTDLGAEDCATQGFDGGTLACAADCTFDTMACTNDMSGCGNDMADPGEDCDGPDLDGAACTDLGFTGGVLGCADDCLFDTVMCTADGGAGSCTGMCGVYDDMASCQCDFECFDYGDCCEDVCPQCDGMDSVSCPSCTGNCGVYDESASCQCDDQCVDYGDCCEDICPQCDGMDGVSC
jgi:hypothetical protein